MVVGGSLIPTHCMVVGGWNSSCHFVLFWRWTIVVRVPMSSFVHDLLAAMSNEGTFIQDFLKILKRSLQNL